MNIGDFMSDKKKHPGGRPKKAFKPWDNWKQDIYDLYSEGAGDIEIRALVAEKMEDTDSCSWGLWDRWLSEEQEFLETIKKGRALCEVWWQKNGRTELKSKDFNATLWYMNMKNRFGWADRQEVKADVKQTVTDMTEEQMDEKLKEYGIDPESIGKK